MAQVITQHLLSEHETNTTEAYLRAYDGWEFSNNNKVKRRSQQNNTPLLIHTVPSNCLFDDITLSVSIVTNVFGTDYENEKPVFIFAKAGPVGDRSPREIERIAYSVKDNPQGSTTQDWREILNQFRLPKGFSLFIDGGSGEMNTTMFVHGKVERYTEVP